MPECHFAGHSPEGDGRRCGREPPTQLGRLYEKGDASDSEKEAGKGTISCPDESNDQSKNPRSRPPGPGPQGCRECNGSGDTSGEPGKTRPNDSGHRDEPYDECQTGSPGKKHELWIGNGR